MSSATLPLRVGTRESKLALLQTDMVLEACRRTFPDQSLEVIGLSTAGDKVLNKPIAELGGTGVFVKELEEALLADTVDFVVHSLKDLPTQIPDGLCLAATLLRDDPRDVFVSRGSVRFEDMPPGCKIATSSRRRAAQLASARSDVQFVDVRGNVPTRLKKLDEGQCDGMVLAAAGLRRLGLSERITESFETSISVPAAGQGALALECRADDKRVLSVLARLNDEAVWAEASAERAFLGKLGGGCSVPIGVLARVQPDNQLLITACIADGTRLVRGEMQGSRDQPHLLGLKLAEDMLQQGAGAILDAIMSRPQKPISPP